MPTPKHDHWHPCLLPDDYLLKLKQDLAESDAAADSSTRREPEPEQVDESQSDEGPMP